MVCLEAIQFNGVFNIPFNGFLAGEGIGKIAAEEIEEETEAIIEQKPELNLEEIVFDHIIHRTEGIAKEIATQNWQNNNLNHAIDYFIIPVAATKIPKPFTAKKHQNGNFFLEPKYSSGYIRIFPDSAVFYYAETDYVPIDTNDKDIDYGHTKENSFFGFPSYLRDKKAAYQTHHKPNRSIRKLQSYSIKIRVQPIKTFNYKVDTLYTSGTPKIAYTVKDIALHHLSAPANWDVNNVSSAEKSNYTGNELRPEVPYTPNEPIPKMILEPKQPEPDIFQTINFEYNEQQTLSPREHQSAVITRPQTNLPKVSIKDDLERKMGSLPISIKRQTISDKTDYSIDSLTELSNLRKTRISYDNLDQRVRDFADYSDEKAANDNQVDCVLEHVMNYKSILGYIAGLNDDVELKEVSFKDTETGQIKKGYILVSRRDPDNTFYHVTADRQPFDYTEGEDGSIIAYFRAGTKISLDKHSRNLKEKREWNKKNFCDVESKKEYLKDDTNGKYAKDTATRILSSWGLSADHINYLYRNNRVNISVQEEEGSIQGKAVKLYDKLDTKSQKSIVVSVERKYLELNADPDTLLNEPLQPNFTSSPETEKFRHYLEDQISSVQEEIGCGSISIGIYNKKEKTYVGIRDKDSVRPASASKISIFYAALLLSQKEKFELDDVVEGKDSLKPTRVFTDKNEFTYRELLSGLVSNSARSNTNYFANLLLDAIGFDNINQVLEEEGYTQTRFKGFYLSREKSPLANYDHNTISMKDLVFLKEALDEGRGLNSLSAEFVRNTLTSVKVGQTDRDMAIVGGSDGLYFALSFNGSKSELYDDTFAPTPLWMQQHKHFDSLLKKMSEFYQSSQTEMKKAA